MSDVESVMAAAEVCCHDPNAWYGDVGYAEGDEVRAEVARALLNARIEELRSLIWTPEGEHRFTMTPSPFYDTLTDLERRRAALDAQEPAGVGQDAETPRTTT